MNSNKRLLKEIQKLYIQQTQRELLENDYLIHYNEENTNELYAIIKAPVDSVYKHCFVRLNFKIPENYPHSPPEVSFVNYDGVRIHPNMYESGKCCATILNTWGDDVYEKWTSSMGIETILLTFHSFLDNHPYMYEPGGRDDETYTIYVKHQRWYSCLIQYLQNETIDIFNQFIHNYLLLNIEEIFMDLQILNQEYPSGRYYCRCFEIEHYVVNYERIMIQLQNYYHYIDFTDKIIEDEEGEQNIISFEEFINKDYKCNICFDTSSEENALKLLCNHSFHEQCLYDHIKQNYSLCPMCRTEIQNEEMKNLLQKIEWIINPQTKRRVKIGSRTYNYLKENGII